MMRITVELDASELARVQKATGIGKKSPAVRRAVLEYLRERERQRFLQKVREGKTDYGLTNEELEARATYDPH
jgi:Arc/MetJ family transcription regulator